MFLKENQRWMFPPTKNWKCLQINEEGLYSITFPKFSQIICSEIVKIMKQAYDLGPAEITITDASSCCGGDAIRFAQTFAKVNCVEFNPENMMLLKNNINCFGLQNCEFFQGSFETYCDSLQQDVVFCDPPWGGPDYIEKTDLRLKYGEAAVEDLILRCKCKLAVLKLPKNYDRAFLSEKLPGIVIREIFKKSGDILFLLCFWHVKN